MAYAAVVTLSQLLDQLLNTDRYHVHYPKPQVENLYSMVRSLQYSLDKLQPILIVRAKEREVGELESKIKDVMYRSQDAIELFISRRICSSVSLLAQDLVKAMPDLHHVTRWAEEIIYQKRAEKITLVKDAPRPSKSSSVEKSMRIVELRKLVIRRCYKLQEIPLPFNQHCSYKRSNAVMELKVYKFPPRLHGVVRINYFHKFSFNHLLPPSH